MKTDLKKFMVWCLVGLGLAGVAAGYWGIYVLVAYFASGLLWWAELLLLFGGPVSLVGAVVALRRPRQHVAAGLGISGFALWVLLWVLCFTVLGFELLPTGA